MKNSRKSTRAVWGVCIGIFLLPLTSCVHTMVGMLDILEESNPSIIEYTDTYTASSSYSARPAAASYQKAPANVCWTEQGRLVDSRINFVWRQCEREGLRDYDQNGKVNCCDRATAFCIRWRRNYKNDVRLCQQMTRNIDHMYVQIWLDGYGWWAVDPAFTSNGTHDMKAVWGSRYNRDYDDIDAYWVKRFSRYIW